MCSKFDSFDIELLYLISLRYPIRDIHSVDPTEYIIHLHAIKNKYWLYNSSMAPSPLLISDF